MLCTECQATRSGWPENEPTREARDRQMLQDILKEEREQRECSVFKEPEHASNGVGNCQQLPSYQIWQALFLIWKWSPWAEAVLQLKTLRLPLPHPLTLWWGFILCWRLLILPKPGFLRLAVYSAETYEVCFYSTERNESIASFIINLMPWERIQQQTRQTRFSGAPIPSTVPCTQ